MDIIVIAAIADNGIIGKDNDIPWRIKEDFLHFKNETMGYPCIMGDKTYESLPVKPLPGRENIVLTFDKDYKPEGTTIFDDFNKAIKYCKEKKEEKVFICGGATIYKIGLEVADVLELTRVHQKPEGDTYFPEIKWDEWYLEKQENNDGFTFETYSRKQQDL